MSLSHNVLVVSDLHLGEDLGPQATEASTLHIDLVEKQLVSFLRYYARRREDGRPWRLVINGDSVDFLAITLLPTAEEKATREDREFGYKRTPAISVRKMEQVAARHQEFFRAMAEFLARKNRVEMIPGNHDAEFHWEPVQKAFKEAVGRAWESLPASQRRGAPSVEKILSRLEFHPWFFYEKGVVWIEHGHQYDECCSFETQLYPTQPESEALVMNVDTAGVRYITNYVREAESHQGEDWSFFGYINFGISIGLKSALKLTRGYYMFTAKLLGAYREVTRARFAKSQVNAEHQARMERLAEKWNMDEGTLRKLDDLRRRPVVGHLRRLLAVLMVDKLMVYAPALLVAIVAMLMFSFGWGLLVSGSAFALAKLATWWSGRDRVIDPAAHLEIVSERLLRRVDATYCVFGHTHGPLARSLESGHTYFNTGTWLPSGKPGLLSAFTHVVVKQKSKGVTAELCQWRDGASRAFASAQPSPLSIELEPLPAYGDTLSSLSARD